MKDNVRLLRDARLNDIAVIRSQLATLNAATSTNGYRPHDPQVHVLTKQLRDLIDTAQQEINAMSAPPVDKDQANNELLLAGRDAAAVAPARHSDPQLAPKP